MARRFGSELGWKILSLVADGLEIFDATSKRPAALLRYGLSNLKAVDAERERRRVQNALSRLKRQQLIHEIEIGRKRAYILTQLGEYYMRERAAAFPPPLPENQRTVVSFDIPERFKASRHAFRHFLRRRGFRQLHRSVWISDLDWASSLLSMLRGTGLRKWIYIFRAEAMGRLDIVPDSM